MTDKNQPINLNECGLNLAIWMNNTEHGVRYNTELTRSYLDKNDTWQQTHSMRESDQLAAANLYRRAHNMIQSMKQDLKLDRHAQVDAAPESEGSAESDFQSASAPAPADM